MSHFARGPRTLLVGGARFAEFRDAVRLLRQRTRLRRAATAHQAAALVAQAEMEPELIVVAQSRPGEIEPADVETLRAIAPLARFVQLLGSWCEGETRSGSPWPAETRLFWHQFVPRISDCLDRYEQGECPEWGLPPATSATDSLLAVSLDCGGVDENNENGRPAPEPGGLIAIHTPHIDTFDTLADLFAEAKWRSVWLRPKQSGGAASVSAGCFDAIGLADYEGEALRQFRCRIADGPILALLDYLHEDTQRLAIDAGATRVLAKPYLAEDLLRTMAQMFPSSAKSPPGAAPETQRLAAG